MQSTSGVRVTQLERFSGNKGKQTELLECAEPSHSAVPGVVPKASAVRLLQCAMSFDSMKGFLPLGKRITRYWDYYLLLCWETLSLHRRLIQRRAKTLRLSHFIRELGYSFLRFEKRKEASP